MGVLGALLLLIRRQVTHDLFRTSVSVGAVACGVIITVAVNGVMAGFETKFVMRTIETSPQIMVYDDPAGGGSLADDWSNQLGIVTVTRAPAPDQPPRIEKPAELLTALHAMPEVRAAAPAMVGSAIFQFGGREARADLSGIVPEQHQRVVDLEKDLVSGTLTDLYASGDGVILGQGLADTLGAKRGDFVTVRLSAGERHALRVVGVIHTGVTLTDLRSAYTLLSVAQRIMGRGREVNRVAVRLHDFDDALEVAERIEALTGKRAISWQEFNTHVISLLNTNRMLTDIVSVGVLIVAGFGILNVLMMTVLDKLNSIALLKAVGYSALEVSLAWLGLGLVVGLLGVAVGCSLGYYVVELLGTIPIPRLAVVDTETLLVNNLPKHYVLAGGVAAGVSMLAALLPALKAGRLDPVEILRGHS
ncbi:MAG: Lipoprotein-releasing system transmembrane protein LolE [Planctomycetes bacterium]|nr:Lipoprotein-releasing system transmembrane protein LolE [Planctomycetota bacterium]